MDEKERANLVRWDGQKQGFYEVYFLKFNDPVTKNACWLRYTITSPSACCGAPKAEVWGIYFDGSDPASHFALKESFPAEQLRWDNNRFRLEIAGTMLDHKSCKGKLHDPKRGHELAWDLRFQSSSDLLYHYPNKRLYSAPLPKTKVLCPHVDAVFSGTLTVDGKVFTMDKAPGQQEHLWGTHHAKTWAWGHCFGFDQDPEAVWEGLDARVKLGPVTSPSMKLFFLRFGGRWYGFNKLHMLLRNKSTNSLGRWTFEARNKELRMTGEINCANPDILGVTYEDPNGSILWCSNTKLASIRIRLYDPMGKALGELTAERKCAFELVNRQIIPGVPIWI